MRTKACLILTCISLGVLAYSAEAAAPPAAIEFNRDVRPILSDQCFACHGLDAKKRKADLRLDQAASALKPNKDGIPAIKPGDLKASSLWERITTTDADDMMPPPESHKKLTDAQRDILKRWIEQGAEYQAHWSFIPPTKPVVPGTGSQRSTANGQERERRNPIDAFI